MLHKCYTVLFVFSQLAVTPTVNGLTPDLLTRNQNSLQPQRLDRSHAATQDQNHDYPNEQEAFDHGLMDKFVEFTGTPESATSPTVVMDYFDGNTVTAFWNYAQHFAMNDNSFGSTPGPSTPGAIEVVSGQTHGAVPTQITGTVEQGSVISDDDPAGDIASGGTTFSMTGQNIGDLLNAKNVTWGCLREVSTIRHNLISAPTGNRKPITSRIMNLFNTTRRPRTRRTSLRHRWH
jgi:phospholipase C